MALKFYWRCESGTFAAQDYSAGDSTPSTSNQTYGTAGAKIGTNGLIAAVSVAGAATFDAGTIIANSSDVDTSVGAAGYWWKCETAWPPNGLVHGFRLYHTLTSKGLRVQSVTGSKLRFRATDNVTSVDAAPTATLSVGTWYFVIVRWDIPNDKIKMELYTDGGGGTLTPVTNGSAEITSGVNAIISAANLGGSTWTSVQWNVHDASYGDRSFSDNAMYCDTYTAKVESNAFITDYVNYSEGSPPTVDPTMGRCVYILP